MEKSHLKNCKGLNETSGGDDVHHCQYSSIIVNRSLSLSTSLSLMRARKPPLCAPQSSALPTGVRRVPQSMTMDSRKHEVEDGLAT